MPRSAIICLGCTSEIVRHDLRSCAGVSQLSHQLCSGTTELLSQPLTKSVVSRRRLVPDGVATRSDITNFARFRWLVSPQTVNSFTAGKKLLGMASFFSCC